MDLRSRRVEQAMLSEPGPECLEVFETVAAFYAFIFLYFFFTLLCLFSQKHFPE